MQPKILWAVGDKYFIGSLGERFRVRADGSAIELAARRTYCLVVDGNGQISSSAISLARRFDVPIVIIDGSNVEGFTWISHGKSVEPLIYQVHAHLNLKSMLSSLFLKSLRENYERVLGVKLEGDLSDVRRGIMRVLEERWSPSSRAKADYSRLLLSCVCWAALYKAGLNPDIGFLHDKLCFDLACEFEHRVVLEAVGVPDLEGAELRRAIAKSVDRSLQAIIERGTLSSRPHSLLWHIHAHAKSLASTLKSGLFNYKPFKEA